MRNFRNPSYDRNGTITVELELSPGTFVPYTVAPNSGEEEMQAIWESLQTQTVPPFVPPAIPDDQNTLSPRQFGWLLATNGWDDVWAAIEGQAKVTDKALYSLLSAQKRAKAFLLSETLAFVLAPNIVTIAQVVAPVADLSEANVRAKWEEAKTASLSLIQQ